ncbi:hypothetical protein DPMN_112374 [Dreissena polymorpha]|uniref:Uncharacterized protein n=1 Tax=Dreissena polymorpha TaxID=45954 RepID=A0A9D4KFZ7_DREPO|nr:hypothetical protein DPMN_112374 [Dreissena polymorpha]
MTPDTNEKAFFQDKKGHNSVFNGWCTMPFGVHHPVIHIYTHTKFQINPLKHFQDMAPDGRTEGRTEGRKERRTERRTDGRMDGHRQNNIPPPMAGDKKTYSHCHC